MSALERVLFIVFLFPNFLLAIKETLILVSTVLGRYILALRGLFETNDAQKGVAREGETLPKHAKQEHPLLANPKYTSIISVSQHPCKQRITKH